MIELRIDRLAAGGDGVARDTDGRVVFVPLSVPGDLVRVRIFESRKRFARGEVSEVLESGPDRTTPRCQHFGTCGGCTWQHVAYPQQVAAKAAIVEDALRRVGGFKSAQPVPVTPSPSPYGYRSRARLVQEGVRLGYRMRRSQRVCVVDECPILAPGLEAELVRERPALPSRDEGPNRAPQQAREWELAIGADSRHRARRLSEEPGSKNAEKKGAEWVDLEVGGERLRVSHGVFAQANTLLLEALWEAVLREAVGARARISAVELYAGAGLFSLGLATRFEKVWAVEAHSAAVADLRFNLERAGRPNVVVCEGPVEKILPQLGVTRPDLVVLDPPRTGVSPDALHHIAALAPERIVYLSCDPATWARDLARLRDEDYRLAHVEAFDLFPQTPHVEVLATLTRDGR